MQQTSDAMTPEITSTEMTSTGMTTGTAYRFEPTATFFYEDLFAPAEQPPSLLDTVLDTLLDTVLARRSRRSSTPVSSRSRSIVGTAARR